ncbi:DUF2690 domain-containing protein [Micromonospora craniellae]|uniref:DUF2690 domain-containing protein n=1 Tax=Micromonospora craniellae TaxID=2294034 RepID=A0A372FVH6_9ACTN|nr:DUF2690 domain-containing protein [Micromonospora craniellae]QOC93148.1 DUF2690 domain-containing protein [Micromonospora craniellae]RFS44797.1 DUF2690 domain-containing protein [Micromonospora craniellae]
MTMRLSRRLAATAAASALTASMLIATPASAACSGYGCDGTDPADTGCSSGAQNATANPAYIMQGSTTLAVVELRWSPSCKTNWGRISNRVSPHNRVEVYVYRSNPYATTSSYGGTGTQYYGDQLYGQNMTVCAVGKVVTASGTTINSSPLCA